MALLVPETPAEVTRGLLYTDSALAVFTLGLKPTGRAARLIDVELKPLSLQAHPLT